MGQQADTHGELNMPIVTEWYDQEQTIILYRVFGDWTTQDIQQMAADVSQMLTDIPHKIDLISDFSEAGKPPTNLISTTRELTTNQPPQFNRVYVVGMHHYLELVLNILRRVYPRHLRNFAFTDSIKEAVEMIYESRSKESES